MRRTLATSCLVLLAVLVAIVAVRPTSIRAGHTPGLTGRTHLIVKEHNLKQLTATISSSTSTLTGSLHEWSRSGVVSPGTYVVPAGRVFIITEIRFQVLGGFPVTGIVAELQSGGLTRWIFNAASTFLHGPFAAGIAYDSGSTIDIFALNLTTPMVTETLRIDVIGYETVDV